MKKWTFLVATLLTVSAGSLMTSCIDNDEPAGIEAIRTATANLLEAKKAVLLAQAEALKVQSENEKILAAADAAIKAAEAKVKEAEAAIKQAQAAGEQAKADQIKAQTEAYIASEKAKLEAMIAQNEINVKNAQLAYDQALYQFEQLKKLNADKLDDQLFQAVVAAYNAYLNQLTQYNTANAAYLKAQQDLAKYELDLNWNGSSFESPSWLKKETLENAVADAQADVDATNESIAEQEEFIAKLKDVEGGELYTLMEEYKTKLKENKDAQQMISVELSKLCYENQDLYDSVPDLQAQINELMGEKIAIAPYTFEGNTAIPGFEGKTEIVAKNKKFSLNDLASTPNDYDAAVAAYEYNIESMKAAISTPNGDAVDAAEIAELERSQAAATEAYEEAQADWDMAVKVYNGGQTPDITVLPKAADIDKAVAAMNTVGASLQTAKDAVVAAHDKAAAADKTYNDAWKAYDQGSATVAATNAKTTWENAVKAANKTYQDAVKENNKTVVAANNAVNELATSQAISEKAAQNRVDAASRQYDLATQTALANPTAANLAAQNAALTAWNNAIAAQTKLQADNATAMQKAQDTAQKAQANADLLNLAADNARLNSIDAANLAFMTAGGNIADGSFDPSAKDEAYKPVQEAFTAKTAADKAYADAVKAFNKATGDALKKEVKGVTDAFNAQNKELGAAYESFAWTKFTRATFPAYITVPTDGATDNDWKKFAGDKYKDLTSAGLSPFMEMNASTGVYTNAKGLVTAASATLYGPNAGTRLEPLTVAEMNESIAAANPGLPAWQYYQQYSTFGAYGTVEGNKVELELKKAVLNNAETVNGVIDTLEANLKTLKDSKDAQQAKVDAVQDQLDAVQEKINGLSADLNRQLGKLQHTEGDLNGIIGSLSTAILTINEINGAGNAADVIDNLIDNHEAQIKTLQKTLDRQEAVLAKAKFQLQQYENGYTDLEADQLKLAVEAAKAELDLQQSQLDFCKARLEAAQAKYEANTKA